MSSVSWNCIRWIGCFIMSSKSDCCSGEENRWRKTASLSTNTNMPLKTGAVFIESCVRSVLLHGAVTSETKTMTRKKEGILKSCDQIMLKYIAGVICNDRLPSKEGYNRCVL